jgi:hypothetical protein
MMVMCPELRKDAGYDSHGILENYSATHVDRL